MNKNNEKYTHINLIKRVNIEVLLKDCNSFSEIGNKINLPRETVYREVRRNRKLILCDTYEKKYSCVHFEECSKNHKLKHYCDPNCTRYELGICERLKKYPLVCNGCSKIGRCMKAKCLYNSEEADSLYKNLLHSSREKPHYSNEVIESINKKITGPIKERGQSVEAWLMNNPDIKVSNTTIRSWINNGTLDVKSSHLRMSGRRIDSSYNYNTKEHKIATIGKEGHRYVDYLAYIEEHKNINVIELDSVIGKRNDNKTILTLMIKKFKLQLGFLLNHHNSTEVKNNLRKLFCKIIKFDKENNTSYFETYFKVFLTDNGSEFDFLVELEKEFDIKVFYTHANASYEKGTCERNHEFIRYILYKGWSFENYNQEEIELIFSHIASYPRKSLNKKTPYECALECTSKEFLDLLNVTLIEKDNVNLTPSLVRTVK